MQKKPTDTTYPILNRKVVCMLVHSVYRNDSRVKRSAISLAKIGYDLHVFAFWPNCEKQQYIENNVNVYQHSLKNKSGKKRFLEMMWSAKKTVELSGIKTDIFHSHDLDTLLPSLYLSRKFHARLIYDSHEWYTGSVHLIGKKKEQIIWAFLERILIPFCDEIITVNKSIAKLFKQRYSLKNDVYVIRNFDESPTSLGNISDKLTTNISVFKKHFHHLIVYGGYIQKGRGLLLLAKALKRNPELGCIVAGDGAYMSELKREVAELGIENQFLFTGMLSLHELYYCYKQADIGYCYIEPVSKSYELALPNKLSQYIQSGLALLGSNLVEIASLIKKYNVGVVVNKESELDVSLITLLNNLSSYKSSSLQCSEQFSWGNEQKKLYQLYNKIDKRY